VIVVAAGDSRRRRQECAVPDLGFVLMTVALFAALALLVRGVERR
jgi:hypothetical protein